jgi:hypothetical protein
MYGVPIRPAADLARMSAGCTDDDDVWLRIDMSFVRLRSRLANQCDAWALQADADVARHAARVNEWIDRWYYVESHVDHGAHPQVQGLMRTLYSAAWEYNRASHYCETVRDAWAKLGMTMQEKAS